MRRILLLVGLGVHLDQPIDGAAQAAVRASARVVPITGAFRPIALAEVRRISEEDIDAGKISRLSVSPTGTVILVDQKPLQILAFPASGGRRLIGRSGSGPGEYQQVESLAWLHDTLVVLDTRLRRVSLFSLSTGQTLGSFPYLTPSDSRRVVGLLNRGSGAVGVIEARTGPVRPLPIGGAMSRALPAYTFAPISSSGIEPSLRGVLDSTQAGARGLDCEDRTGTIHVLDSFWPDRGPIRAFAPNGDLVSSIHDSLDLLIQRPSGSNRLVRAGGRLPVSRAVWDSVAKDYVAIVKNHGAVKCTGPSDKPRWLPMIRGIAIDESGRIWTEHTAVTGGGELRVINPDGTTYGAVALPPRDESIAWFLRAGKLYLVMLDEDGLPSVRVYRVGADAVRR